MRTTVIATMWLWAIVGVVEGQGPPPPRNPTSTSCVAAKNLSVVQAWSTDTINVKENVQRQECHFTVNGSPGRGGPAASPSDPLRLIYQPGWTDKGPLPVPELASVLDASATRPEPGLAATIEKYATQLRNCFAARARRTPFRFDSDITVCAFSLEPFQGIVKVSRSAGVNFSTTSPHLQLGITTENTVHYLFMPALPPQ